MYGFLIQENIDYVNNSIDISSMVKGHERICVGNNTLSGSEFIKEVEDVDSEINKIPFFIMSETNELKKEYPIKIGNIIRIEKSNEKIILHFEERAVDMPLTNKDILNNCIPLKVHEHQLHRNHLFTVNSDLNEALKFSA